jgi:hypothetical protein
MLLPPRLQIATMKFPFRISYPALTYTDKGRQDRKISPKVCVFHLDLLWFRVIVMTRFLFLVPPPLLPVPFFALVLPRRPVANALLGMANIDLLLPMSRCKI